MAEETAIETEAPAEETRPEWLPENFKTPEALVESYKSAESKIHEQGTRLSQLEQIEQENQQMRDWIAQQQEAAQRPSGDPREQFMEAWEDPDRQVELVLHLAGQLAETQQQIASLSQGAGRPDPALTELTARYAQDIVAEKLPDWDDYSEKVSEVVAANPAILGLTDGSKVSDLTSGLERVYWMVKGQALATPEGQAAADAAEAARIAKQAAITQSGASTRPATQSDAEAYVASLYEIARQSDGYGS